MIKIGIIGLGDIAQKAYLPIISEQQGIEVHLFTRNEETLRAIRDSYRFENIHHSLDALLDSGIQGAFVHTATLAHAEIVEKLLLRGIHVYVDKPITYDYTSSQKLIALAAEKNKILMVGFNRRYAPCYHDVKKMQDISMIILQKNRKALPDNVRTFVFDDFIHVVDTLLYLFPYDVEKLIVNGMKKDNRLYHVVIQLVSKNGQTAMGIMNRDSGTTDEVLEVFTPVEKRVVRNVADVYVYQDKKEIRLGVNDWEPTLRKRGFEQIVKDFLLTVKTGKPSSFHSPSPLLTHQLCETVVEKLEAL